MNIIKEMRYWIDKINKLNENANEKDNNVIEIKEYTPFDAKWNYIKDNILSLWDFLNNGYKKAGYEKFCGCDNHRSLLRNANLVKIGFYNNEWVAVSVYTGYRDGFKNVGITATTNDKLRDYGVRAVRTIIKNDIGNFDNFFWSECSGAIEYLYEKYNGIKIPNEYVENILQKSVTIESDGFHYSRLIQGDLQRKIMYGFNNKETFDKILSEREQYINNCINNILANRIDESTETPSFGKLSQIDCAIAIVNFFVDERWENECYELPETSLNILKKQVEFLKKEIENNSIHENKLNMAQLAIENGINILETTNIMTIHSL